MNRPQVLELLLLTFLSAAIAALIPLSTGYFAWSWDALNHHIYLGLIAESPRWHLDVLAASYQSYQYPYLYWPVYRLSLLSGSGSVVGALWAALLAMLLLPPVWFISRHVLPAQGPHWKAVAERCAACVLACTSCVILTGFETTSNDMIAAVPLMWALVLGLSRVQSTRRAFGAAVLCGVAVAFKLSNAIFLPLLFVFWWLPGKPHWPLKRGGALALGSFLGFAVFYSPWGLQLWAQTGNPFYPFLDGFFPGPH